MPENALFLLGHVWKEEDILGVAFDELADIGGGVVEGDGEGGGWLFDEVEFEVDLICVEYSFGHGKL